MIPSQTSDSLQLSRAWDLPLNVFVLVATGVVWGLVFHHQALQRQNLPVRKHRVLVAAVQSPCLYFYSSIAPEYSAR